MKKGLTELVFILDRSGSMSGLEKDTLGGFNSMLKKQKEIEEECYITTVLFDHHYKLLHDRINLKGVSLMTEEDYQVGGSTALLDTIGKTIHKISNVQKNTHKDYRAEKVMFVIITDGEENASREFTSHDIKAMIEQQKKEFGWEFIFLGANIDAVETARGFGIDADRAQNYFADARGTTLSYLAMNKAVTSLRKNCCVDMDWKAAVEEDYQARRKDK